jgi:hypothetical protein
MATNMSMFEVTGGAVNVGAGLGRLRREVQSGVIDTDSTSNVHIITPLEHFKVNIEQSRLLFPSLL